VSSLTRSDRSTTSQSCPSNCVQLGLDMGPREKEASRPARRNVSASSMVGTRRPALRAALLTLALLFGLGFLPPATQPAASPSSHASARATALGHSLLHLLNKERAKRGLGPLRGSSALTKAARWQSRDMVNRGYFDHERHGGPSLTRRVRRSGYLRGARGWDLGENLALGEGGVSSRSIVAAWMRTRVHRVNILDRTFEHIGIGLAAGSPYGRGRGGAVTITTDFGARG